MVLLTCLTLILIIFVLIRQQLLLKTIKNIQSDQRKINLKAAYINDHLFKELQKEKKAHTLLLAFRIREAVAKQIDEIRPRVIEESPQTHGLTSVELAQLFTPEHGLIIEQYWSSYHSYLKKHWYTDNGQLKKVFKGHVNQQNSDIWKLHHASKQLVNQLDNWLTQLK